MQSAAIYVYIYIYIHTHMVTPKTTTITRMATPKGPIPVTVGTVEACQGNAAQDTVTPRRAPPFSNGIAVIFLDGHVACGLGLVGYIKV